MQRKHLTKSNPIHDFKKRRKKTPSKLGIEKEHTETHKDDLQTTYTDIIFNCERLNAFSVRSETRHRYLLSPLLLNILLEVLVRK